MVKQKILIAMSGGVDSSVCASLLKQSGLDCMGATMRLFSEKDIAPDPQKACARPQEADDARRIAAQLKIPFEVIDLSAEFRRNVIDYFIRTYIEGGTPNPCVECNRTMKFGLLYEVGMKLGCDLLATGHYARISSDANGRLILKKAVDASKDQSYVLWSLTQEQLARTRFPLGELTKNEVRAIADANGFCNANRPDSQDICFIPDGNYAAFIEKTTQKSFPKGNFINLDGKVLGQHQGLIRYTVGQRKGLGIALGKPAYVCKKNIADNTVTLGSNEDLFRRDLTAHGINLIAASRLDTPIRVEVKVRYSARPAKAIAEQISDNALRLHFDEPQRAICAGQSVVLYDGDTVIGGGVIDEPTE